MELDHFDSPEEYVNEKALENLLAIKCPWRALIADGGCVKSGLYTTKRDIQVKWLQLVGDVFSENAAPSICQDMAVLLGGVEKDAGPEVRVSWLHAMAKQGSAASTNDATRAVALLQDDRQYAEAVADEDVAAEEVDALVTLGATFCSQQRWRRPAIRPRASGWSASHSGAPFIQRASCSAW